MDLKLSLKNKEKIGIINKKIEGGKNEKRKNKSSQPVEKLWGGGLLESRQKKPRGLLQFNKNKKQKRIIILSILGIFLVIGGICSPKRRV